MWFLIGVSELERYLDERREMYLIDLRDRNSFRREHIRGAVNIPAEELPRRLRGLPQDRLIVLYCYHGPQSMLAGRELAKLGFETADVCGGIQAYRNYRGKYLVENKNF